MKEFIEFIAKHLVDSPDQVNVDEKESEDNKVILSLKVQSDDVGKFKNFNDKRDTGVFIGRELFVAKDDFVNLPENTFSFNDLIGSKVFQCNVVIGVITDVITAPANDVIVIKKDDDKEFLIPLVLEFIEEFDPEKKILILKKEIAYDDED